MSRLGIAVLAGCLLCGSVASAQDGPAPDSPHDFAISRQLLEEIVRQGTFLPTFKIRMSHRSDVKSASEDCEIHLAGELLDFPVGDPEFLVVEPPNLCRFMPGQTAPATGSTKAAWRNLFDTKVLNKDCEVTGFPRFYTEHASGSAGPSNPNHIFEIHPATAISCNPALAPLEFKKFFVGFQGLKHIQPASADQCLETLRLWVRFHNEGGEGWYEFFEQKSPRCGNLAIIEAASVPKEWVRKTGGGHTAIARVTADGGTRRTLKLYSVEGTAADEWLERRLAGKKASSSDPRMLHGFFTYDYFAMLREISPGGKWSTSTQWTEVHFPMAFVVLGPTTVVPWTEQ